MMPTGSGLGVLEGGIGVDATQMLGRTLRTNSTLTDHKAQFWTMNIAKPDKVAGIITQKAVDI